MKLTTPVYVLGLERNFRGDNLVNFLKADFKEVNVFFGFDAYSSSESEIEEYLDLKLTKFLMHRKISRGEAGCAISHKMIHDEVASRQVQSALILEDDCLISDLPKMLTIIQEFNRTISLNPDLPIAMQLGSLHFNYSKAEMELSIEKIKFPSYGTFGYLLSQSAAVSLSKKNLRISATADWPIWALDLLWYKPSQCILQVQLETSTILQDRSEIFFKENQKRYLDYFRKTLRYLAIIFGIRILIANRHKISTKLVLKWDIQFKYWRKTMEKKNRKSAG